jgi:antitoxin component of MazEF toxin-antitoxin module
MVKCVTRKWGSSIGIVIPSNTVNRLNIQENETVDVQIMKRSSTVLQELWNSGSGKKISLKRFKELRRELDSKYL